MTTFTGPWNQEEVRDYLQTQTVPIRIGCRTLEGNQWMLSLWYLYEDGAIWCATGEGARILDYLGNDPEAAFEVSPNEPPYRGVRGRGLAEIEPDKNKQLLKRLIRRYLGDTESELAGKLLSSDKPEFAIRLKPEQISSWDYSSRMADID